MNFIVARMEDWDLAAKAVADRLSPGSILALSGPLGAGKTTFVQALARALGSKDKPRSPTFSLVRAYKTAHSAIKQLVHVDAYRIESEQDILPLGLEEYLEDPATVMAIEWPEQISAWLAGQTHVIRMQIEPDKGSDVRRIRIA
ncbi:tRNA (adenosine(37)-N6)-threonylcarbamoyltransferase complex ATPase subunit type 1 TsaE [Candidatus Uhrbacteria bacterium]|nr:tRNA (adenosine(37)-N6)-threonylcarbamoyltransferase complex ATPase subunit type 1 TsaE [Candidatus Uhrbacteria bacterium]